MMGVVELPVRDLFDQFKASETYELKKNSSPSGKIRIVA